MTPSTAILTRGDDSLADHVERMLSAPLNADGFDRSDSYNDEPNDEPRPARSRTCRECGGFGGHANGCPEA